MKVVAIPKVILGRKAAHMRGNARIQGIRRPAAKYYL